MTSAIQWGKGTFDDPSKLGGEIINPISVPAMFNRFPLWELGSATPVWQYVVPAGKRIELKNLLVAVIAPKNMYAPATVAARMGTALLVVDGTTKQELSIQNYPLHASGTMWTVDWPNGNRCPSLGEGVDFTSGQVVKVQVTPLSAQAGLVRAEKWIARLHGKNPTTGGADLQIGSLRSPNTGSAVDILSYTAPANGFRLMSWDVKGYYVEPWCATVQLYINGSCVCELGYLGFHGETTVFGPQSHNGNINLLKGSWGVELNQGDRVEVWAHALLDFGQSAVAQMAYDETGYVGSQPNLLIGV